MRRVQQPRVDQLGQYVSACAWELAKTRTNDCDSECVGVRFDDGAAKGLTGFSLSLSLALSVSLKPLYLSLMFVGNKKRLVAVTINMATLSRGVEG